MAVPIITVDQVKLFLGIPDSNTTKDDLIEALIPCVESDVSIYCNRLDYPAGMQPVAALMINYLMGAKTNTGKQSESIGTYSYTMGSGINGYPDVLMSALNKYKLAKCRRGTIQQQWRDQRGSRFHAPGVIAYGTPGVALGLAGNGLESEGYYPVIGETE